MRRFRPDPLAVEKLERHPAIKAHLSRKADAAADAVRAAAASFEGSGRFRESIQTKGDAVYSDDPAVHLIEFGSANNRPYAAFRKGLESAGIRYEDDGGES